MKTKQEIEDFLQSLDAAIDFLDYVDIDSIDPEHPFDSIYKQLNDNSGFNYEVLYADTAAIYLSIFDPSLTESKKLALDHGYNADNATLTTLASLLLSERVRQQFLTLKDKIDNFFKN